MSFTTELIDAAKSAQGIASDYRLAQVLGVTRATVSTWRHSRAFPSHSSTCELSRMAGMDAGAALLGVGVDRLRQPEKRPVLASIRSGLLADAAAFEGVGR